MHRFLNSRNIISTFITVICVVCFFMPRKVGIPAYPDTSIEGALMFSLFHCNIAHMMVNLIALWRYRPRLHTLIVAFCVSVATAMMPFAGIDGEPTYGLSAFLFAAYARMYAFHSLSVYRILGIQLLVAFIPHINWKVHLCAFLMSHLYWTAYYGFTDNKD